MVEIAVDLVHVVEVEAVVQFRELKDNVDNFRLVGAVQTAVFLAIENALTALVDEVGANRVFGNVGRFVPLLLLRKQHHSLVVDLCPVRFHDCVADVAPDIGRIIPVQIDQVASH